MGDLWQRLHLHLLESEFQTMYVNKLVQTVTKAKVIKFSSEACNDHIKMQLVCRNARNYYNTMTIMDRLHYIHCVAKKYTIQLSTISLTMLSDSGNFWWFNFPPHLLRHN